MPPVDGPSGANGFGTLLRTETKRSTSFARRRRSVVVLAFPMMVALASCGSGAAPDSVAQPTTDTAAATAATAATVRTATGSLPAGALLAVGVFHACKGVDGLVECWGANDHGQLGRGDARPADGPVPVQDLSGVTLLAAGDQHTCAVVQSPGEVWCWGLNDYGQLGVGDTSDVSRPTRVAGITDAVALTAGDFHTCAVSAADRSLWCWGMNISGQVGGFPSDEPVVAPRRVDGLEGVRAVDGGFGHTCAVVADRSVSCWGDDIAGQAGGVNLFEIATVEGVEDAVEVRVGMYASCARTGSGEVRCWGQNDKGQFGADTIDAGTPVARPVGDLSQAKGLGVGLEHVCALTNGAVRCLGTRSGDPTEPADPADTGAFAMPGITDAVAIDASYSSLCAARADRTVRCWNYDTSSEPVLR